ncbi:MAG: glycosyltransferase family 2 protein [Ilyomonas sp.]
MAVWFIIFWLSCFIIFYNYIGYALPVLIYNKLKKRKPSQEIVHSYPSVSFIVAAYNEEEVIEDKIINSLSQNYPRDKIEFIFITDGSTDETPQITRKYSIVILLHQPQRFGKSAALNRAIEKASNDIIILSDANAILNTDAILHLTKHYVNEEVGGVAGEKRIMKTGQNAATDEEGFYWKYESFLKKIDSDFYSVVGAAGELFSFRKTLYEPLPDLVVLDDFVTSIKIAAKGFRIVYEPNAYAIETPSLSIKDEKQRKIRIAAGGFQAITLLPTALFFWRHFKLSFLYVSHRVLRWTFTPFCLIATFISNVFLLFTPIIFYKITFLFQAIFYLLSFLPVIMKKKNVNRNFLKLPYYFVFMNSCVIQGFILFITKGQTAIWDKAKRSSLSKTNSFIL